MISNNVLLYGASGHAKVICSIYESNGFLVDAIFDDDESLKKLNDYNVIGKYNINYKSHLPILVSIGDNKTRKFISNQIHHKFSTAIHISSIIDNINNIGFGSAVFHNTTIQRDVIIGKHCIINTSSSIDHDTYINDYVHISPSVTICGSVEIGEGTHVGAAATILPNLKIGKWCIIGAGAIITKDIPDYSLVVGVPGKIIKNLKNDFI